VKYARNTAVVVFVATLTAVLIYAGVQLVSTGVDQKAAAATVAAAGQTFVCPQSGCMTSTCHGATGSPPPTACPKTGCKAAECHGAKGEPAPTSSTTTSPSKPSAGTMTCPKSGCTASTCHGATGSPPPSRTVASASSSGGVGTMTCPKSGCTSSSCHGAGGDAESGGGRHEGSSARRGHSEGRDD
jgi:hypothetical protein